MKARRIRVEVNLEELDQIIDRGTQTPLSESDGQKLKAALHAMAERLSSNRSTEKTRAVLEQSQASVSTQQAQTSTESHPAGHGRHSAAAFSGAAKIAVSHATLKPAIPVRNVCAERCISRSNRQRGYESSGRLR